MTVSHELNRDVDIDLAGIFGSIWRNKFKLLFFSILATVLAFFVLQFINPRYRSEAKIFISVTDPVLSSKSSTDNRDLSAMDERGIASKVELLKSRNIADEVISELKLDQREEFTSETDLGPLNPALELLGLRNGNINDLSREDRVVDAYYDKLKVFTAEGSRVIVVQFSSQDRQLAAKVPTLILSKYENLQQQMKSRTTPQELQKLRQEVAELNREVKIGEAEMAEFRDDQELFQGKDNATLATQELSELATELGRVRSQRSQAEADAAAVSRALNSGALDTASRVLQSPLIQRLRERQVNLRTQLSDLSTTLLPGHPRIKRLQSQVNTLDNQIRNEARKIESSLQQEVRVARQRENDLLQHREELKIEAGRVGKEQVELQFKERELAAKRDLLSQYSLRLKEAEDQQKRSFSPSDAFVFSKAKVPTKAYFPKKGPILAGVFFGTFMLGAMLTLAGSILSGTHTHQGAHVAGYYTEPPIYASVNEFQPGTEFESQQGVQNLQTNTPPVSQDTAMNGETLSAQAGFTAPPLAPQMSHLSESSTAEGSTSPAEDETVSQEVHNGLKGNVSIAAQSLRMLGHGRIAVLTPESEVGSGAVVLLARQLAEKGSNVILVDLTSSGESGKLMLGRTPAAGVKDLLSNKVTVADSIHCDGAGTGVHVMPAGQSTESDASKGAERLPVILDALQHSYDFVVLDCGEADIQGLKHISDVNTVTVINSEESGGSAPRLASEMLVRSGFGEPLLIHATAKELDTLAHQAA